MARYINGVNGSFSGTVGTVVGVVRKGRPYMRSKPKKRTAPATVGEAINRQKFAMAQAWLKPVTAFVREGFKGYSEKAEGFVAAKSYLLKHAIEGEGMAMTVNPALMKVSWGDLPLPEHIQVAVSDKGLTFTWDASGNGADQVMILPYIYGYDTMPYLIHGALRKTGKEELALPGIKGTIHLYVAFISADRSRRSNSIYLGTVVL